MKAIVINSLVQHYALTSNIVNVVPTDKELPEALDCFCGCCGWGLSVFKMLDSDGKRFGNILPHEGYLLELDYDVVI